MTEPTFTEDELVTAMCLWEAWLDLVNLTRSSGVEPELLRAAQMAKQLQNEYGSFTIRGALADLVRSCDDGWRAVSALTDDDAPVFDWEWCPRFIQDALVNGMMRQAIDGQYGGQKVTRRIADGKDT